MPDAHLPWVTMRRDSLEQLRNALDGLSERGQVLEADRVQLTAVAAAAGAQHRRTAHDLAQAQRQLELHATWMPLLNDAFGALAQGAPAHTVRYDGAADGLGQIDITFRRVPE